MQDSLQTQTRIDEPTPNGGTYSIAYWKDAQGNAVVKSEAVAVEIVEFNANNEPIHRTYGSLKVQD